MSTMAAKGLNHSNTGEPWWAGLDDEALLDQRLCDLTPLPIEGTPIRRRVDRLREELSRASLRPRPHVWLSSEWFSPDGVPGIALPFYLAHPRLVRLEQKQVLEAEGAGERAAMRILRHEAGHAIDTAHRLHRRKRWRELFGRYTTPYPASYRPRPRSRHYVVHLRGWYAQAHPAEDFAETFAVWLGAGSLWRHRYRDWPRALEKLEYVDHLMGEVKGRVPPVRSRRRVEPLKELTRTLGEHYRQKRAHYTDEHPRVDDRQLRRIFSESPEHRRRPTAASFLRRLRPELRRRVAQWTGTPPYTIDQVLTDVIDRCKAQRLRLALPPRQAREEAMLMLSVQTMHFLHSGHYRVAV